MISYEEYKKTHDIKENEYVDFLDVTSWKKNNQKKSPRTTNNSDDPNYILNSKYYHK
jgi:hypothetical protein